jgi:hypothetical protein
MEVLSLIVAQNNHLNYYSTIVKLLLQYIEAAMAFLTRVVSGGVYS